MSEAARANDLTQQEIERWLSDAEAGMENALKANPKNLSEHYEKQIKDLHQAARVKRVIDDLSYAS